MNLRASIMSSVNSGSYGVEVNPSGAGHVEDISFFCGHALDSRLRQNQAVPATELSDFCGLSGLPNFGVSVLRPFNSAEHTMTILFVLSLLELYENHSLSFDQLHYNTTRPGVDLDVEGVGVAGRVRARPAVPPNALKGIGERHACHKGHGGLHHNGLPRT